MKEYNSYKMLTYTTFLSLMYTTVTCREFFLLGIKNIHLLASCADKHMGPKVELDTCSARCHQKAKLCPCLNSTLSRHSHNAKQGRLTTFKTLSNSVNKQTTTKHF